MDFKCVKEAAPGGTTLKKSGYVNGQAKFPDLEPTPLDKVYNAYRDLWRGFDRPELKVILSSVECIHYPSESSQMMAVKNQQRPVIFFCTGFRDPSQAKNVDANRLATFKGSEDKSPILDRLNGFLAKSSKLKAVSDLCIQSADEMLSNAIYSAPTDVAGKRLYQDFDRATKVLNPAGKSSSFFASFSDDRVIVGVQDPFGSLGKAQFTTHLNAILADGPVTPKRSVGGAGIGMRFMIDNSANFYVYSDKRKRTVFACGFLLKGVKANFNVNKHLHCSFR